LKRSASEGWSVCAEALAKADRPIASSYGWQASLSRVLRLHSKISFTPETAVCGIDIGFAKTAQGSQLRKIRAHLEVPSLDVGFIFRIRG
jgi:hypothetical protein